MCENLRNLRIAFPVSNPAELRLKIMTDNVIAYEWHTVTKRVRSIFSVLFAIGCVWVAFHARTTTLVLISVAFAFAAIAAQVDQRVCIDMNAREVSKQITLGKIRLWSSRHSLNEFTGIGTYRLPAGTPQAPREHVHVGLRRSNGSIFAIRYFAARCAQPCPEAQAFAHQLAETTNLSCTEGHD
jgi:hypothetical protein